MNRRKRGNGEGSIFKLNDGRWRAAISIGKDVQGKPKRKTFTAGTRHEVKEQLAKALNDQRLGIPIASDRVTISRFLEDWLEQVVKPSVKPKTHRTYADLVRLHIEPAIGSYLLTKL